MAKPKHEYHIDVLEKSGIVSIWCDKRDRNELITIEGVDFTWSTGSRLDLFIDPRYDINEIADEVKELLLAKVPDIFKE